MARPSNTNKKTLLTCQKQKANIEVPLCLATHLARVTTGGAAAPKGKKKVFRKKFRVHSHHESLAFVGKLAALSLSTGDAMSSHWITSHILSLIV